MKTTKLGLLIAVAGLALACGQASETADTAAGDAQTFSEAAGELESDVAAGADQAGQDATDQAKRDAAAAIEEGIQTE